MTEYNALEKSMPIEKTLSMKGEVLTVVSKEPQVQGSRVCSTLKGVEVHGKVAGIARDREGLFRITLRLHNLSKADRKKICSLF